MSEELDPEVLSKSKETVEEDPLAELARIVAGEPEPEDDLSGGLTEVDPVDSVQLETEEASVENHEATSAATSELSPEEAEVDATFQTEETLPSTTEQAEAALELAGQELQAALDEEFGITDDALEGLSEEPPQTVSDQELESELMGEADIASMVQTAEQPVDIVKVQDTFQVDLISALQQEIEHPDVEAQEITATDTDEENVTETVSERAAEPEGQELETVPEQQVEAAFVAADVPEETEKPDLVQSAIDENVEDAPPIAEPAEDSPNHSIDDDLGAVFANEFEQMLAKEPPQTENVFEEMVIEEASPIETVVAADAGAGVDVEDLDFGSAFAEELGVEKVIEAEGWSAEDTETASAAFAEQVQPGVSAVPAENGLQTDPGHAGAIPNAEGEPLSAANENGSSRKYAIAALVIALGAGTIAAGYGFLGGGELSGNNEPQLIKAEATPFKVEPDDPGGRVAANEDKASYERVAGEDTDKVDQPRLISGTEEPADIPDEKLEVVEEPATNLAEKTDARLTPTEESSAPDTDASASVTPRVVQTVTVKPDGTIVTSEPLPPAEDPVSQVTKKVEENLEVATNTVTEATESLAETAVAIPKPVETVTIKKPEAIDGAASTGVIAVPEASPLPKPEPKPKPVETASVAPEPKPATQSEAVVQPARKSEWVVQVSSQRSPEAAQASFQNLRNRFSALQGRAMSIQRAIVNGSTFYRVRIQTASRSDANTLCSSLKASGGSCFVTR
ncbi:MAG: SPOR domain-containing protein [Rhizobiaceae bacterium]